MKIRRRENLEVLAQNFINFGDRVRAIELGVVDFVVAKRAEKLIVSVAGELYSLCVVAAFLLAD